MRLPRNVNRNEVSNAVMRAVNSTLVFVVITAAMLPAQSPPPPATSEAFDVVSIKLNRSPVNAYGGFVPNGFEAVGATTQQLISLAYGVSITQILDAPPWIRTDTYDVTARTGRSTPASPASMTGMLQRLLTDRFRLVVHREQREAPVYALLIARSDGRLGSRLNPAPLDCDSRAAKAPPGTRGLSICGIDRGPGMSAGRTMTIAQLSGVLGSIVERQVVDRTSLAGNYDWDLSWTPTPGEPGPRSEPTPAGDGVSIFTAVQEQLGLKLESERGVIDALVIDRIERPTSN